MENKIMTGIVIALPFCFGGFYIWTICLCGILLCVILCRNIWEKKKIVISMDCSFLALGLIGIFHIGTMVYGIDKGMSLIGAIRYLAIPLLALLLLQMEKEKKQELLKMIPDIAAIMTIVSVVCYASPLKKYFFQGSRLGGFFQYSNTFALFLLLGMILLVYENCWGKKQIVELLILIAGIFLTGSKGIFLFLFFHAVYFFIKEKSWRKQIIALFIISIFIAVITVVITGNHQNFSRFLLLAGKNRTMWKRLLYDLDGLKMLKGHPLGLGYMGFYYLQPSMQVVKYSTKFVHNDILQMGLDAGVVSMFLLIAIFAKQIFAKDNNKLQKHLLLVIFLHSCIDFNLQYFVIWMVALLCMEFQKIKVIELNFSKLYCVTMAVIGCMFIYIGGISYLEYSGEIERLIRYAPWMTTVKIHQLSIETDANQAEKIANDLLKRNSYISQSYGVKAEIAYLNKDYKQMMKYEREQILHRKCEVSLYEEYITRLYEMLSSAERNGRKEEVKVYLEELLWIQQLLEQENREIGELAYRAVVNPKLEIGANYRQYLIQINEYYKSNYEN